MKILINAVKGFRKTLQVKRLIIMLFLLNFLFALFLAVPMYHSLRNSFGDGLVSEKMLEGFDYLWWEEYRDQNDGLENTFNPGMIGGGALLINLENLTKMRFLSFPPLLLIFGFIYILFHTFLAGGVLAILNMENPSFSLKSFFSGAGHYFLPFVLYMLFFWFFLFFLVSPLNSWLTQVLSRISRNASSEILPFVLELIFSAVILFLILFIHMIFDYIRIKTVQFKKKAVFQNAVAGVKFVLKNFRSALGLYFLIVFSGVLLSFLYVFLASVIDQTNVLWIAAGFVVQQLFIFGIIWIRCWLYAGEIELHRYI
jgi:hypothetical protein